MPSVGGLLLLAGLAALFAFGLVVVVAVVNVFVVRWLIREWKRPYEP